MKLRIQPRLALKRGSSDSAKAYSCTRSMLTSPPLPKDSYNHRMMAYSICGVDRRLPPPRFLKTPSVDQRLMFLQGI